MKYYLLISEIIGFVVISMSAAMVSIVSSFLQLILRYVLKLIAAILNSIHSFSQSVFTRTNKNGTNWIVIRLGKFSILLGKKNDVPKSDL